MESGLTDHIWTIEELLQGWTGGKQEIDRKFRGVSLLQYAHYQRSG